ncbi:MAG: phage tail assembly chaperone [Bosea sp. (in: a-proteobacteria)]|nr:MAG: phage tail assembly chaperone [Bosea sp. (in: a-proteobacteria)]
MAFGLGRLGWAPDRFWASTPRELAAAIRAFRPAAVAAAPDRAALEGLLAAFPDG